MTSTVRPPLARPSASHEDAVSSVHRDSKQLSDDSTLPNKENNERDMHEVLLLNEKYKKQIELLESLVLMQGDEIVVQKTLRDKDLEKIGNLQVCNERSQHENMIMKRTNEACHILIHALETENHALETENRRLKDNMKAAAALLNADQSTH